MKVFWIQVVWLVEQLKINNKRDDMNGDVLAEFSEYNPIINALIWEIKNKNQSILLLEQGVKLFKRNEK